MTHDLTVLAGAGLGLIGIDHQIVRAILDLFGHERPFQAGAKARPTATAQAGILDLVDHPVAALGQHVRGRVPRATFLRAFQSPILETVKVREDPILVFQDADHDPALQINPCRGQELQADIPPKTFKTNRERMSSTLS